MGPPIVLDGFQEMAGSLFRRSAMFSSANLKYLRRYFQPMATNSGVTIDLPFSRSHCADGLLVKCQMWLNDNTDMKSGD